MKKVLVALVMGLAMLVNAAPAVDAAPVHIAHTEKSGGCDVYVMDDQIKRRGQVVWSNVCMVYVNGHETYYTVAMWDTGNGPCYQTSHMKTDSRVESGTWQWNLYEFLTNHGYL